jgi:flagellar protein FliS
MKPTQAYSRATSETASPERLMVLLFEAALRHMRHAASLLDEQKSAEALPLLAKAGDIVSELAATFDADRAPELAVSVGKVYVFVSQRLAEAAWTKNAKLVRDAELAFEPLVDGFSQAVASLRVASSGAPVAP